MQQNNDSKAWNPAQLGDWKAIPEPTTDKAPASEGWSPAKLGDWKAAPKDEPSFSQRVGEDISQRLGQVQEAGKADLQGKQSGASTALQTVGAGAGLALDVGGEAVKSVVGAVPESIKQPVAAKAKQAAEYVAGTDVGKAGMAKAVQVKQAWDDLAKKHPEAAKDLSALGNIVMAFPGGAGAEIVGSTALSGIKAAGGEAAAPYIKKAGESLVKRGEKKAAQQETRDLVELLSPKLTKKEAEANVPKTEQVGVFRRNVVVPDEATLKVANTAGQVPGVNPSRSYQYNYNKIDNENVAEARRLSAALKEANVPIPPERVAQAAMDVRQLLAKQSFMVGDAKKASDKMMKEVGSLLKKNGYTAHGLLETRKEFDRWAQGQIKGDITTEPNTARKASWTAVRNSLNGLVADSVPDAKVRASLEKQSNLFTAMDNLTAKAAGEGKNIITRGIESAEDILPAIPYVRPVVGMAAALPYAAYKGAARVPVQKPIGKGLVKLGDVLSSSGE